MSSREKILSAVLQNQPAIVPLPDIGLFERKAVGTVQKFGAALSSIGGNINYINDLAEMSTLITAISGINGRVINLVKDLYINNAEVIIDDLTPHDLQNVELAILSAHFGVAENGAVWITEENMGHRVLPFICQHLVIVIHQKDIVPAMHEAYELLLSRKPYDYGCFIAGPSKTADIEQSLVIGAHGPRSMTVFVLLTANN